MKLRETNDPKYTDDLDEYLALGKELKQTTREKIASKFNVTVGGLSTITKLTLDDFRLIQALILDRQQSMARRKFLRRMINP